MSNDYIEVPAVEVIQPIGTFYVAAIDAEDLVAISYADIRRIEGRDIEKIVGIQRPLLRRRVVEITQYVRTIDATFPTSVILAIDSEDEKGERNIELQPNNKLRIKRAEGVAQIIDGQHRIAGLCGCEGTFQINVSIFVDMDLEDKGNVFATINLQQTKVNKSLAYDLYEYAQSRSPQKTAHNIAKLFDREEGSPFHDRIKILGTAMGGTHEFLTQAAFVDRLLPMISRNPMGDRDQLKRGKKLSPVSDPQAKSLVFRRLFIEEKDAVIARILWNYFRAVSERWPQSWNSNDRGNILPRTNGFAALMRFFVPAYQSLGQLGEIVSKDAFLSLLRKSNLEDKSFTREDYSPGTSGQTKLFNELKQALPDAQGLFDELS